MSTVNDRLTQLGIDIPRDAAPPAGIYVSAVISGHFVYTAGQLPLENGTLPAKGKVGAEVTADAARVLARTSAINGLAAISAALGSLDRITRVV